ncbi:MAG: 5-methylcytosine restriction system specificity protein McrC [Janthinobacterium lividum]
MIPLATLYYLLCYAWQRLPAPAVLRATAATPFHRPLELLTQMLLHAAHELLRGGLPRSFQTQEAELRQLRGRIELAPSLGRGLLPQGRAVCTYDELSVALPLHQLVVGTVAALATHRAVPAGLRRELGQLRRRFPAEVVTMAPNAAIFSVLRRQRPASQEAFLLHLCELIYETSLPAPADDGRGRFADFRRDERLMARLFEQAVRNFYRREQRHYRVFTETIAWQAAAAQPQDLALLPTMLTDTSLENATRKIILDTKYYAAALRPRYDQQRLIAPHLYQLYAYLQNVRPTPGQQLEGILLYPAGHEAAAGPPAAAVNVRYTLGGHPVRIVTINLHQPWPGIAADLLALVH